MATKARAPKEQRDTEAHAKTRILLALWDMRGAQTEVKKGELTRRVGRSKKGGSYQNFIKQLEEDGAIAISKNKVSLPAKGVEMLTEGFKNPEFEFESQIGAKTANALLKWIRERGILGEGASTLNGKAKTLEAKIASYDKFKLAVLEVYNQLNRDYNLDELVPIYRIRREVGDRVTRSQFNEWLLKMQENDILQLMGGEMTDITPDKAEDSISTELGGLRYYAQRLSSEN